MPLEPSRTPEQKTAVRFYSGAYAGDRYDRFKQSYSGLLIWGLGKRGLDKILAAISECRCWKSLPSGFHSNQEIMRSIVSVTQADL